MKFFALGILADPSLFRLTPDEAAEIDALVLAFRTALAVAWSPDTRMRGMVSQKNDTRKAAERAIRPAAQLIRANPHIANELKINLGLTIHPPRRKSIPAPFSIPLLTVAAEMSGWLTIKARDSATYRRARPASAKGMELYERVRLPDRAGVPGMADSSGLPDPPPASPHSGAWGPWRFVGTFTRTPMRICPQMPGPGAEVSYVARWVTARGEPGPLGRDITIHPQYNPAHDLATQMQRDRRIAA